MSNIQTDKFNEHQEEIKEEKRHVTNDKYCWCKPTYKLVPETGNYIIIHNKES